MTASVVALRTSGAGEPGPSDRTTVEPVRARPAPHAPDALGLLVVGAPRAVAIGRFHELGSTPVVIGRSPDAHLRLDDPGISRHHLRIEPAEDGGWIARDLESTNGTFLRGVAIRASPLVEGDRLLLGGTTELVFGRAREVPAAELRMRQAVAAAGAGTFEWRVETGALSFAGGVLRALRGQPESTAPTLDDDWLRVHEADREALRLSLDDVARRGGTLKAECRVRRADGGVAWLALAGEAFRDAGRTVRVAGTAMDVSERKRAELELRRQALLFDSVSDAVVVVGLDGTVLDWNAAAERAFGWRRADALGCRPGALLDPAGDDGLTDRLVRCAREGSRLAEELSLRHRGGAEVRAELVAVPLRDPGAETLGCVAVLRDVGERRRLEHRLHLAERLASLGTLAAGVAHEVKNPLSFVTSNLEFIASRLAEAQADPEEPQGEVEAALRDCRTGLRRIREIVNDLGDFTGARASVVTAVDLNAVVDYALRVSGSQVRHRAKVAPDLAPVPRVPGGEGAIGQVVLNLLINAAHATPPGRAGEATIRIATRHDAARERVVLEIADEGTGIAPEHLPRIFEPFFTTKPVGSGTGLGLFVCHGIVTALGGEIEVHSQVGAGSTFRVLLPLAEATDPDELDGASDDEPPTRP